MHDQRQSQFFGQGNLPDEGLTLLIAGRMVAVEIQTDFTMATTFEFGEFAEFSFRLIVVLFSVVRMNATAAKIGVAGKINRIRR
jgi:hypothetical protein